MPNLRRCKTFLEIFTYVGTASLSVRSTSIGISEAVRILSDGARHLYPCKPPGCADGRFPLGSLAHAWEGRGILTSNPFCRFVPMFRTNFDSGGYLRKLPGINIVNEASDR